MELLICSAGTSGNTREAAPAELLPGTAGAVGRARTGAAVEGGKTELVVKLSLFIIAQHIVSFLDLFDGDSTKIDEMNLPTTRLVVEDVQGIIDKAIEKAKKRSSGRLFGGKKNKGNGKELDETDFM